MPSLQPNEKQLSAERYYTLEDANNIISTRAKISEQERSNIDFVLNVPPKWANIAHYLYDNNPDKAKDFLARLLKINPKASESAKTTELLSILNEYSDHSVSHSKHVVKFFEDMNKLKNTPGFEAIRDIDFLLLALAVERHDVGKLGMPDRILNPKQSIKYSKKDKKIKKTHPVLGHLILKSLGFSEDSQRSALTHHLRYITYNGELRIVGYPVDEFKKYCKERGEKFELRDEDHLAAFADVFSALTDSKRKSDIDGTNKIQSIKERYESAFAKMESKKYFGDEYYTNGKGAPLYSAFKKAMEDFMEFKIREEEKLEREKQKAVA